jgi:hypothetical protein
MNEGSISNVSERINRVIISHVTLERSPLPSLNHHAITFARRNHDLPKADFNAPVLDFIMMRLL